MKFKSNQTILILFAIILSQEIRFSVSFAYPNILIGILARNKAHTLPYTLSYLERLKYPKKQLSLW